jgi:hypothetical protein
MDNWEMGDGESPAVPAKKKRTWLIALIIIAIVAVGGALLWRVFGQPRGPMETPVDAGVDAGAPDSGAFTPMSLPEGDALLRKLAGLWSKSADLAKWLAADDLIRRLTAAVNLVADGESPAPVLTFIPFKEEFSVDEEGGPKGKKGHRTHRGRPKHPKTVIGRLFISPASYARYDAVTRAFMSVDPDVAGKAYGQLRPYFDTAFAQIGRPGKRFDDVLAAAIRRLVSTPLLEGKVEVVPKGAVYAFKDPAIESRSAAEKLLLRMGPANGKAVQESLRRFAGSAGLAIGP